MQFRNTPESFQDDANAWIAETAERDRESGLLTAERDRLAKLRPVPNRVLGAALAAIVLAGSAAAGMWLPFGLCPGSSWAPCWASRRSWSARTSERGSARSATS